MVTMGVGRKKVFKTKFTLESIKVGVREIVVIQV
jgi:hypothetical protein